VPGEGVIVPAPGGGNSEGYVNIQCRKVSSCGLSCGGADPEEPDEYRAKNVFWVPKKARSLPLIL